MAGAIKCGVMSVYVKRWSDMVIEMPHFMCDVEYGVVWNPCMRNVA